VLAPLLLAAAHAPAGDAPGPRPLQVFAAASLTEAFQDIAAAFTIAQPGLRVEFEFGGSAQLRVQIEHGAPADVFAAADLETAEALQRSALAGEVHAFATNRLVIAVPSRATRVADAADLARAGVKLVLASPGVPAGRYAAAAIEALDRSGRFGSRFAERVRANVVSEESNVRLALQRVLLGEADAGLLYGTDVAAAGGRVRAIELPAGLAPPAHYGIAVVRGPAVHPSAAAFVAFVLSPRGRAILSRHGFGA